MNKDQEKLKHFYRLSLDINRKYQSDKSNRIAEEIKKCIKKTTILRESITLVVYASVTLKSV